ncbi:hypothetical protein D3C84_860220 [compost metagenome]
MAQSDGPAIDVDLASVPTQLPAYRQGLNCKCFVGFDEIELIQAPPRLLQAEVGCEYRSYPHHRRLDANACKCSNRRQYR